MRLTRGWCIVTLLQLLVGCSSGSKTVASVPIYDTCFDVTDCVESATFCEPLAVEFSGFVYENAICTTECAQQGPLAPDCARAFVGRRGSCYPASAVGGIDDALVCFEPCEGDADCLIGFRCLTALDLCGVGSGPCPIAPVDAICVPGPS